MDWMDCPANKTSAVPITSAVPTISSNSASTSAFDMSKLKMEVTSKDLLHTQYYHYYLIMIAETISPQVEQSLAINGRDSPNILKSPSMSGITGILGLEELMRCSETYSRKVFVGGLPPEVDEG